MSAWFSVEKSTFLDLPGIHGRGFVYHISLAMQRRLTTAGIDMAGQHEREVAAATGEIDSSAVAW